MIRALLHATRVRTMIVTVVVSLVAAYLTQGVSLGVGLRAPLLSTWLAVLVISVVGVVPLTRAFGRLEDTFPRKYALRVLRAALTGLGVGAAAIVLLVLDPTVRLTTALAGLAALGFLAGAFVGDRTPIVVLVVGAGLIMMDHLVMDHPVSGSLMSFGLPKVALVLLGSAAVYVVWQRDPQNS